MVVIAKVLYLMHFCGYNPKNFYDFTIFAVLFQNCIDVQINITSNNFAYFYTFVASVNNNAYIIIMISKESYIKEKES